MDKIMKAACMACPYRKDVASGVWASEEYDKLPPYDAPTAEQPFVPFACHAQPEQFCHGWAVCHTNRGHAFDLLALRLCGNPEVPKPSVPLFASGAEASEHGKRDIESPGEKAEVTLDKLLSKHKRLRVGNDALTKSCDVAAKRVKAWPKWKLEAAVVLGLRYDD